MFIMMAGQQVCAKIMSSVTATPTTFTAEEVADRDHCNKFLSQCNWGFLKKPNLR